jgi:hypothetical protein
VFLVDSLILFFAGGLAGFVATSVNVGNNFTVCVNGIMSIMSALRIFGSEKANYLREMQAGMSSFSYWLGKSLAYVPIIFLNPLFFMASFYKLGTPECAEVELYRIIVAINFSATGIGCFISTVTTQKSSQLAGVVFGLIAIMTSGGNPTLKELEKGLVGRLMTKFTYGPFAMGSLYLRGATNGYKASFDEVLGLLAEKGYTQHEIDIYSDEQVEEANLAIEFEVTYKETFMLYQYGVYMFLTLVVLWVTAKQEVGGIFNNCFYNRTVQNIVHFVLKIWNGDLDDWGGDNVKRTQRGMKTRKTVKLGHGHDFTDAIGGEKRKSVKRMSKVRLLPFPPPPPTKTNHPALTPYPLPPLHPPRLPTFSQRSGRQGQGGQQGPRGILRKLCHPCSRSQGQETFKYYMLFKKLFLPHSVPTNPIQCNTIVLQSSPPLPPYKVKAKATPITTRTPPTPLSPPHPRELPRIQAESPT